jgi:hypothetical protein
MVEIERGPQPGRVTHERIRRLSSLSARRELSPRLHPLRVRRAPIGADLLLLGASAALPLVINAPRWCAERYPALCPQPGDRWRGSSWRAPNCPPGCLAHRAGLGAGYSIQFAGKLLPPPGASCGAMRAEPSPGSGDLVATDHRPRRSPFAAHGGVLLGAMPRHGRAPHGVAKRCKRASPPPITPPCGWAWRSSSGC